MVLFVLSEPELIKTEKTSSGAAIFIKLLIKMRTTETSAIVLYFRCKFDIFVESIFPIFCYNLCKSLTFDSLKWFLLLQTKKWLATFY